MPGVDVRMPPVRAGYRLMSGVTVTCQRCAVQVYSGPGDGGPVGAMLTHYRESHGPVAVVVRCEWCLGRGRRWYIDRDRPEQRNEEVCSHCQGTGWAGELGVAG